MRDYVGIVRSNKRLKRAIKHLDLIYEEVEDLYRESKITTSLCELRNMINVAHLIIRQSLDRKENKGGYYIRIDENLTLKRFFIAESCGTPYTGYLVKKKGLYYYKNNRIGSKENRSAKMMHELFIQFLKTFQLKNKEVLEPIKEIVEQEFIALQEESINAVLAIGEKSNEIEKHL